MRTLQNPVWIGCLLLFVVHQAMQWGLHINIAFADNYLDCLLAMPVVLTLLLAERQWLFNRGMDYRLPLADTIMATVYVSLVAEGLFPILSPRFTADVWDVVCYALGSVLFWFAINRPPTNKLSNRPPATGM